MKQSKYIKQRKARAERFYNCFCIILPVIAKCLFLEERLGNGLYLLSSLILSQFFQFPKILSLKSFRDSWCNSYPIFFTRFYLWWIRTFTKRYKVPKCNFHDCSLKWKVKHSSNIRILDTFNGRSFL